MDTSRVKVALNKKRHINPKVLTNKKRKINKVVQFILNKVIKGRYSFKISY